MESLNGQRKDVEAQAKEMSCKEARDMKNKIINEAKITKFRT